MTRTTQTPLEVNGQGHAVTDNQPYFQNDKDYELQTWYTDGIWRPASPTCGDLKGRGHQAA